MLYRTVATPQAAQQRAARQAWRKQLFSVCTRTAPEPLPKQQHSKLVGSAFTSVAAALSWNSHYTRSASLGLARHAGSLVAVRCMASGEALAASPPAEDAAPTPASTSHSSTAGDTTTPGHSAASLALSSGAFVLPHPDKVHKGGEDWYFIAENRRAVGVADGVGGWAEVGVDAGAYARQLMNNAQLAAEESTSAAADAPAADLSPQEILEKAYSQVTARGSCTACIVTLNRDTLLVSNIGDSGMLVMRAGKVAFHTPQQQHDFNFPYQIGATDSMSDLPSSSQRFELTVQPGDLLVLGTDGLWDNCFDEEVASVLRYCVAQHMEPPKMAQVMAHYARHRAADSKFASPFAYAAFQAGFTYMGGKMDDITVVIAHVQQAAKL